MCRGTINHDRHVVYTFSMWMTAYYCDGNFERPKAYITIKQPTQQATDGIFLSISATLSSAGLTYLFTNHISESMGLRGI